MEPTERFYILPEPEALAREAAKAFVEHARVLLISHERLSVCLCAAEPALALYRHLARAPFASALPWERFHFFWTDERIGPHEATHDRLLRDAFLDALGLPESHLHPIDATLAPDAAAARYERALHDFFGPSGSYPPFDILHLALGPNAQIAALAPHAAALRLRAHPVYSVYLEEDETHRVTLTPSALNSASRLDVFAADGGLADTVRATLVGPRDPLGLPAQLLFPLHGELVWWLTQAAAAHLDPEFLANTAERRG